MTTPDTAEAKIEALINNVPKRMNELVIERLEEENPSDAVRPAEIAKESLQVALNEATQQLKGLLVDAQINLLKKCYVDQGEIYVRFNGGFAEQYERIKQLTNQKNQLGQTRQEEVRG